MNYTNIKLRNITLSDVEDEINWFTINTNWMTSDTPWEDIHKVDIQKFKQQTINYINSIDTSKFCNRLEIEVDGVHVGFVSSYPYNNHRAIGIEICNQEYQNKKIGRAALSQFLKYHFENNIFDIYLETHNKNLNMIKSSESIGFEIVEINHNYYNKDSISYDRVLLKLNVDKFNNL